MMKYGVSEAGFIRKPYNKIKTDLNDKARKLFGEDVDLSVYSPIGLFVKMLAWNSHVLWQEIEGAYYANWLETAEGVNLDRIVSLGGLQRKPEQHGIVHDVCFYGLEGTVIPESFEIRTKEEICYKTMDKGIIEGIKIDCNLLAASDRISISAGNRTKLSEKMKVYGTGIQDDTEIDSIDTARNEIVLTKEITATGGNVELIFCPKALINCRAVEPGPSGVVAANTLTEIATSLQGLESVTNENGSVGALDIETDAALRKRYRIEGTENKGSSVDAIRNALVKLEDVVSVVVHENITLYKDPVSDMPPKSVECLVQGGRKEDIAFAIFKTKSAGIATYGNTISEIAYDGRKYEIHFTRPEEVDIHIDINLIINDEWEDQIEDIQTNIIQYIGGTDTRGEKTTLYPRLDPGAVIYPWRIRAVNKDIKGIELIDSVKINNMSERYQLTPRQIPFTDNSKITINK